MPTMVSSIEFQDNVGSYLELSGKEPVVITRDDRPLYVLLDIDEYERLKSRDTRRAWYAHEVPDAWLTALDHAAGKEPSLLETLTPPPGIGLDFDWEPEAARIEGRVPKLDT